MEKTVDWKMPGLMELGKEELKEFEGGGIITALAGFVGAAMLGAATVEVITDGSAQCWKDFKAGYRSTQ